MTPRSHWQASFPRLVAPAKLPRPAAGLGVAVVAFLALLLAACGAKPSSASGTPPLSSDTAPGPSASVAPSDGAVEPAPVVEPAPGSSSAIYEPNPGAIVVAIDPGHGGCLDWGVPDPSERGTAFAEKAMTLGIALQLRDLLAADGIAVVMMRDDDSALAGDFAPDFGCEGPAFRDVNGDGSAGFDERGTTRTRDELQARLDLANLVAADVLLSIHINSPTDGGQVIEVAFTETYYTDETPWGVTASERLAADVQAGVVAAFDPLATYERGDRGITAHNLYIVAPPNFEPSSERPDARTQPTRGALMPTILSEVGSITLRAEHDLLVAPDGQRAVAAGVLNGLVAYFAARPSAARIGLADATVPDAPEAVAVDGPPFWARIIPDGPIELRITNTGTSGWTSAGLELVTGWEASDQPYLARAPAELERIDVEVPALGPGDSVVVSVELPPAPAQRALAWISLGDGNASLADIGSPALQLSSQAP